MEDILKYFNSLKKKKNRNRTERKILKEKDNLGEVYLHEIENHLIAVKCFKNLNKLKK